MLTSDTTVGGPLGRGFAISISTIQNVLEIVKEELREKHVGIVVLNHIESQRHGSINTSKRISIIKMLYM